MLSNKLLMINITEDFTSGLWDAQKPQCIAVCREPFLTQGTWENNQTEERKSCSQTQEVD